MRKFLILIILLINTSNISAEEIRSRFGFYITVPSNFIAIQNQNMDDLLELYEGSKIDKQAFNDMMAGVSKENMNVEYFFPTDLDFEKYSININIQKADIKELQSVSSKELCPFYSDYYSKIFKKKINQYKCEYTSKFSPKFNIAISLFHDGATGYLVQYQIQTIAGLTTFTAGCETKQGCNLMDDYLSQMIRSIRN